MEFSASQACIVRCILLTMMLDEIDNRILDLLQRDGRISNQDLADQVGLSPSPCLRRTRLLENEGIIQKYVALVDPAAVGQGLQAIVEVRLDRQTSASVATFEKEILKYPQVLECYLMAGDWDYMLRVVARDLEDFRDFCVNRLARIPAVRNVKSNICMKQVKNSTALPLTQ
jgi:DNA-binding Lrp family transcriptional regulator